MSKRSGLTAARLDLFVICVVHNAGQEHVARKERQSCKGFVVGTRNQGRKTSTTNNMILFLHEGAFSMADKLCAQQYLNATKTWRTIEAEGGGKGRTIWPDYK